MSALPRRPLVNAAVILGVGLLALGAPPSIPPLAKAERALVKGISLQIDATPSEFTGDGSQELPWRRWKAKPPPPAEPVRLLSIDADPEGYFSSSPPAPVDCAQIFKRLFDAGHRHLACGYLMAWDEPDPLAIVAVHKQLDRFDSAVLGLPLSRGAAAEPVPAPFLRLSLEASNVEGDTTALPAVNKVAAPHAELGGERTLAGFTLLENESKPADGRQPLLARWGERIVFSLPLAGEIAALGLKPSDVQVALGREIRLGPDGPVVAIDSFGRGELVAQANVLDTPAWKLISDRHPVPPAASSLLIRDAMPDLPEADRAWSESLPGLAQAIRSSPRFERAVLLPRPPALVEMGLVLLIAFFAAWASWMRSFFWRVLVVALVAGFAGELVYLLASRLNLWLPPLAISGMSVASLVLALIPSSFEKRQPAANPRPWESPDYQPPTRVPEPEVVPVPVPAPVRAPLVRVRPPEPEVIQVSTPAPAPLLPPLTRVQFVNGVVVLPESARAIWAPAEPESAPPTVEEVVTVESEPWNEAQPMEEPVPEAPEVEEAAGPEPEPFPEIPPAGEPVPDVSAPPPAQPVPPVKASTPAKKPPGKKPSRKRKKKGS
ncbi:hypothetical protein [Luteolibacter sp. Populi]|uniref:hypothetical protein n=1 Tax=Luteolibacter sp. Populi TaxID=3230487 RepID=UPI003466648F